MTFGRKLTAAEQARFEKTLSSLSQLSPSQKIQRAANDAERARLARGKARDEMKDELAIRKTEQDLLNAGGATGSDRANAAIKAADQLLVKDKDSAGARALRSIIASTINDSPDSPFAKMAPQDAAMAAILQHTTGTDFDKLTLADEHQNWLEKLGSGAMGILNYPMPKSWEWDGASFGTDLELETPFDGGDNYWLDLDNLVEQYNLGDPYRELLRRLATSLPQAK